MLEKPHGGEIIDGEDDYYDYCVTMYPMDPSPETPADQHHPRQ
jgi:hypothetical protein